MRTKAAFLVTTIVAVLAMAGAAAGADAVTEAKRYDLRIPRQSLDAALKDLATQTRLQIGRFSDAVKGDIQVGPLNGNLTVDEALKSLLAPSGLAYLPLNDRGYIVVTPEERKQQSLSRTGSAVQHGVTGPGVPLQLASLPDTQSERRNTDTASSNDEAAGELTVTGSRIRGSQQAAAPITVIDREIIERRGFSTVEDIIRSLPQNLATMNAARSVSQPVGGDGLPVGPAAQGEVTANLRGLGQSATLVLIDGRRTAGSAAFGGAAVNLASIPVASIERVEVLSDSAAAVYGSDAIAGVINIVLRKDFRGASTSVRTENGMNGGDKRSADQVIGFGWEGGNLTATLSWSETRPINSARAGYITNDLRYLGGYDNRSESFGQPGVASVFDFDTFETTIYGSLPSSFDGTENWTMADLSPANFELARADLVPRDQSSDTETRGLHINIRQRLTDRLEGSVGLRYSQDKVAADGIAPFMLVAVSETNPYNNSGMALDVGYYPQYEADAGLIPLGRSTNKLDNLGVDLGLRIDLPVRDWQADITGVHSIAKSRSRGYDYSGDFAFFSPEAGESINPFGNGTAQNIQPFLDAFGPLEGYTDRRTRLSGLTVLAEGSAFQLPAGEARVAAGGEYRIESLNFGSGDYIATGNLTDLTPEQHIAAVFGEVRFPVVTDLALIAQGRWEQYDVETSDPVIDGKSFEKISPRAGLVWEVMPELTLRGSWGKSFKAPNLTNLVVIERLGTFARQQFDPIAGRNEVVFFDSIGNPRLKPEFGETTTVGFDWRPPPIEGLRLSATYSRTEFSDRIVGSIRGVGGLSDAELLAHPEIFPGVGVRDPVTNRLQRVRNFPYNVAKSLVEAVDFDVRWAMDAGPGEVSAGLQGTYTLKHMEQPAAVLPGTELQGTTNADRFIAVMSFGWTSGNYGADVYGNFTNAYWNTEIENLFPFSDLVIPPMHVRSRTTWDVSGYYSFGDGWRVSAGVRNLFDEEFPFHQGFAGPFDTRRVDLRGRLMFGEIRKDFSF